jgi:hypothetical protein
LFPGKHHLSEKQLVVQTDKAIESGRGIVRAVERKGQAGAKKDERTAQKVKYSWSFPKRY